MCREAFDAWDIVRIHAEVFAPNAASRRVLEKAGFSLEGPGAPLCTKTGRCWTPASMRLVRESNHDKAIDGGAVPVGGGAPCPSSPCAIPRPMTSVPPWPRSTPWRPPGCEIIRVAIPDQAAAEAVDQIKEQISIPLIADIHFNYKYALACAERGIDAIRINPGNIGGEEKVKAVADICRQKTIPIRIGGQRRLSWKRTCGPNTAASRPRHWWRAPWATWPF